MNIRLGLETIAVVLLVSVGAFADVAQLQNSDIKIDLVKRDGVILLHVDQTAKAWNWTVKTVGEGNSRLLAVCRETICLPISLKTTKHEESKAGLYLDAKTLGRVMGFNANQRNGEVILVPAADTKVSGNQKIPAYHDAWGKGRGFREGQTLPDIPLVNLEGEEVRLGQFLGKQYVLYGWASW